MRLLKEEISLNNPFLPEFTSPSSYSKVILGHVLEVGGSETLSLRDLFLNGEIVSKGRCSLGRDGKPLLTGL